MVYQHFPIVEHSHGRMLLRAAKFRGSALRRMPRYVDTLTLSNQAWSGAPKDAGKMWKETEKSREITKLPRFLLRVGFRGNSF